MANYRDDEEDEYGMGAPPREPSRAPPPGRPPTPAPTYSLSLIHI